MSSIQPIAQPVSPKRRVRKQKVKHLATLKSISEPAAVEQAEKTLAVLRTEQGGGQDQAAADAEKLMALAHYFDMNVNEELWGVRAFLFKLIKETTLGGDDGCLVGDGALDGELCKNFAQLDKVIRGCFDVIEALNRDPESLNWIPGETRNTYSWSGVGKRYGKAPKDAQEAARWEAEYARWDAEKVERQKQYNAWLSRLTSLVSQNPGRWAQELIDYLGSYDGRRHAHMSDAELIRRLDNADLGPGGQLLERGTKVTTIADWRRAREAGPFKEGQ